MNKARFEWVVSGLKQYVLTAAEIHFINTALEEFDRNQGLTEKQEERLETLYKLKSQMIPNKKSDHEPVGKGHPQKARPRVAFKKAF
jgi:hypothetical protein